MRDLPLTERPPWNEHQNCSLSHPRTLSTMRGVFSGGCVIDGSGWSNFSVQVQRCLMCQRIFEGAREYGREVGTLEDAKCYGARQGVGRRVMVDDDGL